MKNTLAHNTHTHTFGERENVQNRNEEKKKKCTSKRNNQKNNNQRKLAQPQIECRI